MEQFDLEVISGTVVTMDLDLDAGIPIFLTIINVIYSLRKGLLMTGTLSGLKGSRGTGFAGV